MKEKTALILGGAKGLGLEIAKFADRNGVQPSIYGRDISEAGREIQKTFLLTRLDLKTYGQERQEKKLLTDDVLSPDRTIDYFFWVAGIFLQKPLAQNSNEEIDQMIDTHFRGAVKFLRDFHALKVVRQEPYHLITIASTSSYRLRERETLYCTLKSMKVAFTINFATELFEDLPGSKVLIVNPGGIKTPNFWKDTGRDISNFMEPALVAEAIWDAVFDQHTEIEDDEARILGKNFDIINIIRNDDGSARVEQGLKPHELP